MLEAMGSTNLNLLLNVNFNLEVGQDAAMYWSKENNNLANLIDYADCLTYEEASVFGAKAKDRIRKAYSWEYIAQSYEQLFLSN